MQALLAAQVQLVQLLGREVLQVNYKEASVTSRQ